MKTIPFAQVKRKDRSVEDEAWIRAMLHRSPVGVLATTQDGQPYINTNLFVFDEAAGAIYTHTARAGRTRTNIEGGARVCFSVSEMGRLLPADTALEMSVEYASVVVFGFAMVVTDDTESKRALESLLKKYFAHLEYGKNYRSIQPDELACTAVYRIQIEEWSGKHKQVEANFPGAFFYREPKTE
jgi:uncharacterized protein